MKASQTTIKRMAADKTILNQLLAEQNAAIGFIPDPLATGELAQKTMIAIGVVPEDNILSSGIISARNEQAHFA